MSSVFQQNITLWYKKLGKTYTPWYKVIEFWNKFLIRYITICTLIMCTCNGATEWKVARCHVLGSDGGNSATLGDQNSHVCAIEFSSILVNMLLCENI
jgi:hypothetical protein